MRRPRTVSSEEAVMEEDDSVHECAMFLPDINSKLDGRLNEACSSYEDGNSWMVKIKAALIPALWGGGELSFSKKRLIKTLIKVAQKDAFVEAINAECELMVLKLINVPDPDMQILGCLLLAKQEKFTSEETLKVVIPPLIQLLNFGCSSQSVLYKEVPVLVIKRLAKRGEDLRLTLGRSGAFSGLLNLASRGDGRLQILALQVLRELVLSTKINQDTFVRAGGLQVILDLVSSCSVRVKCLTTEILGVLASLRDIRREIASHSGVSSLIEAVKVGSMASKARAAHALGLLAFTKRLRRMIVHAGGIPVLIDLLRDGDEAAKLVAGNSLGILSACVDHLWQVAQAGAIPLFIELLKGGNPHGKDIAEDAFCILAVSEENALAIIDRLVRILCHGNVEAKAAAADIIWDLSSYRHSVSIVIVSGAIPVLVGLLKDENDELRENVSGAIAQLTYNDDDRQALAETGVIPILVELLQDRSTEVKGNATEALHNFAEDPTYRSYIIDACAVLGLAVGRVITEHAVATLHSLGHDM